MSTVRWSNYTVVIIFLEMRTYRALLIRIALWQSSDVMREKKVATRATFALLLALLSLAASPVLAHAADLPRHPTSITGKAGDAQISLQWSKSPDVALTSGYLVEMSNDGAITWTTAAQTNRSAATSATIDGLKNGTTYNVRVLALALDGARGDVSDIATLTPQQIPTAPVITETTPGDKEISLVWTFDAPEGTSISGFVIQYSKDGGVVWKKGKRKIAASARTWTMSGLDNGVEYTMRIAATTLNGVGTYSSAEAAQPYAIAAATSLKVSNTNSGALLTWGKSASIKVTSYSVEKSPDDGAHWKLIKSVPASVTRYSYKGDVANLIFRIGAIDALGNKVYTVADRGLDKKSADAVRVNQSGNAALKYLLAAIVLLLLVGGAWMLGYRRGKQVIVDDFSDFEVK
ncbi:unannotated protein [freshwater metagenome]|uniref:Unannotated protein n=1 Tax=freshwater metagenome TaxID=449393 RepID=A0A6J6NE20_9ZZZZ|nr:hypothetical protein [Actinomycetota bacterium]MSY51152.1 hypothetical protein [Actinomycetota bacterium]